MAKKYISTTKGGLTIVNVAVAQIISILAVQLAVKTGIQLSEDQQTQITIMATASLSGLVAALSNWIKHKPKK
jgi:hypothetical protein